MCIRDRSAILGFIGVKLILHALHENNLPFVNGGENVPVQEIPTLVSLMVVVGILIITVVVSLKSSKGQALIALQNAEKFAYRYQQLPEDCPADERAAAARRMDEWTEKADGLSQKWRDQLLDHKDRYSSIIRTAHETRLSDSDVDDSETSRRIVEQAGPRT